MSSDSAPRKRSVVAMVTSVSLLGAVALCGAYVVVARSRNRPKPEPASLPCVQLTTRFVVPSDADTPPAVAFSPDGKTVATSGKPIQVWDAASGALVKTIAHTYKSVDVLAFTADGKALAIAGGTTTVRDYLGFEPTAPSARGTGSHYPVLLWNLDRSQPQELLLHKKAVGGVSFAPDGQAIATMPYIGDAVTLWNAASGTGRRTRWSGRSRRPANATSAWRSVRTAQTSRSSTPASRSGSGA
jgi:WD40 repeat protein